ncbi:MAG TPA: gluconokinase [Ramlibacter sp.]|jgi:gluconokinase|uniref:gluconokinase n=1 Tax=Ramlibacter sp. TaxID=1917967 RepID=UPI002D5F9549|nr:gluconokinase [Ramlibacter sp.]HZY18866.1 gluconokinase [Ramlibacter sp.]
MPDTSIPIRSRPGLRLVVMGVAGCGKSAVGERLATALGVPLVEGDSFHPPANIAKMREGKALDDADRAGWLAVLGEQLADRPEGAVLTCSALKAAYRQRLRAAAPELRFVHLSLTPAQALARVASRQDHFYPPSLVDSQFAALEDPRGEPGVVSLDASQPMDVVVERALQALRAA